MISVYDIGNTAFDKNGDAVLTPVSGSVHQVAGGAYDLTMTHPVDPDGKWTHLVPEAIIKAPVPEETIENAFSGLDADVYTVNNNGTALRSGPHEPTQITYSSWAAANTYSVGDKVTFAFGVSHKNYQCTYFDADDTAGRNKFPPSSSWWTPIADMTSGDPALVTLKAGTELYYVEDAGSGWYKMSTAYGLEGYVKSSQITYSRHLTPAETQPRTITEQLFRIKDATVDARSMMVTVNAQHVSYDLNGVMIDHAEISRKGPAEALAWIEQAFMIPYQGAIATNMTSSDETSYSADISGRTGMYAIIDPDNGVVKAFDAEFRRDNWDLFVMEKTNADSGFRIRYGNNMRGLTWRTASDDLVTRVVPVARDANGDDFYLEGTKWIDSDLIDDYPVIRMERIRVDGQVGKDDGSETGTNWTEQTLRAEMEKQAQARFDVDHADVLKQEITVDFEMLGDTEEYRELKNLQHVILYDTVLVFNERIGLGASVTVNEITYDIIRKKITALKLSNVQGYNVKSVGGFNVLNNSITGDKLTDDAARGIVGSTREDAVRESNTYTNSAIWNLQSWVQDNFVHN